MRFVPIKNIDQQAILSVHRARQGFVKARTAQGNQIRGLLMEYGITLPQGIGHITKRLHGARSVIRVAAGKTNQTSSWLINLVERRHKNVAAVALANKNARIVWALLTHQREYQSDFVLAI